MVDTNKIIVIGDRVLIKPETEGDKTKGGLYLPPGVKEKEKVQTGYIIKVGPGYPVPSQTDESEPWKEDEEQTKYVPLQVKEGDQALYLKKDAVDVEFDGIEYVIAPQSAILLVIRDEDLLNI
jgi:co-chaperonin GroES (HSP10)